jgi:hypothetical protein
MPLSIIILGSAVALGEQLRGAYHPRATDVVTQST